MEWTKFVKADPPNAEDIRIIKANCRAKGLDDIQTARAVNETIATPVYINSIYQVAVHEPDSFPGFPDLIHLSIKRRDKESGIPWRDMQRIKNEIIGKNHEGVELYPNEGRKVDLANQYHLFVLKQPDLQFPFGFQTRAVSDTPPIGGRQDKGAEDV